MKLELITERLSNEDIALRQLHRSILLFLDEADYVSALTLAGAAEEILGKLVREAGSESVLDELIAGSLQLCEPKPEDDDNARGRRTVARIANYHRNRMKHFSGDGVLVCSTDYFAADMIERAISNYWRLWRNETSLMQRFKDALR